jgi:hypothetical protein
MREEVRGIKGTLTPPPVRTQAKNGEAQHDTDLS